MNTLQLKKIRQLYTQGKSVAEISKELGCSNHKVTYWMQKTGIPKRSIADAMYNKYNPDGDPFKIREIKTIEDAILFGLGIGIYWGEGNKVTPHSLRVSNTDPDMTLAFVRFLMNICGVKKQKMRFSLICFNDSDIQIVTTYWSKVLGVSEQKFGKIVQIPPQGKGTYRRKSQFGVCTVSVSNIKLKQWMLTTIDEFRCPGSLMGKQAHGKG